MPDKLCLGTLEEKCWTKAEIPKFSQVTVLCLRLALDRNKYLLVSCSKLLDLKNSIKISLLTAHSPFEGIIHKLKKN